MEKLVKIALDGDLQARPVAMLVQVASKFDSNIYLETAGKKVNAKSIMGMMSLSLKSGDEVTVRTEGTDEAAALTGIEDFLTGKNNG